MRKAPIETLRTLSPEELKKQAKRIGEQYVNEFYLAIESNSDGELCETFLTEFAKGVLQKNLGTLILNRQKNKGKTLVVCQEYANALCSDVGVEVAEGVRNDLKGLFDGSNLEIKKQF